MTASVKKELQEKIREIIEAVLLDDGCEAIDLALKLIDDIATDVYDY